MNRRRLLHLMACAVPALWLARASAAGPPKRIVALSWELTETLLALGHTPIATALPLWYRRTVAEPPLPDSVVDVGLLYQPSFEVLRELAPDLLILTPGHAGLQPALARLAPTLTLGTYMQSPQPYPALQDDTRKMALALDSLPRAEALIEGTAQLFDRVHQRIALTTRRTFIADVVDEHHLRVYGRGSLFAEVLQKIGVPNAADVDWISNSAGSALVPLQRLVGVPLANLMLVGPVSPGVRAALRRSLIWQALPCVRDGLVTELPVIAPYGGLFSMQRFARAVEAALLQTAHQESGLV